jgi:adenine-specific DNA-methyltransferase
MQLTLTDTSIKLKNKKIELGQFYTSKELAKFMIDLSSKKKDSPILEPCFGEGVFLKELEASGFSNIKGYEIDKENYKKVEEKKINANIELINYLDSSIDEKFDLIIGNPPYVHWNKISKDIQNNLSSDPFWSNYSNGEWDLLYAFIIWSVEKLNNNGELIFIVPYNWFNSTHAKSLRSYLLKKGRFEIICHFGEAKLFKDCYPNNIIFKYRKTKDKKGDIKIIEYKGRSIDVKKTLTEISSLLNETINSKLSSIKFFNMNHFEDENLWYLADDTTNELIENIESSTEGIRIKDRLKVGVGMVSGYDQAFRINKEYIADLKGSEFEVIKSFVKAQNCKRYIINNYTNYLYPENIESESELRKYPMLYERMINNKEGLKARYLSKRKNWWQWATIRNLQLFNKHKENPKIFVPCMDRSKKSRFSLTSEPLIPSGDVIMIVNKDLKEDMLYVLAWLNSDSINKWYRIKGAKLGDRIKYTQSYVEQIPLKLINWKNSSEVDTYNKIISEVKKILSGKGSEEKVDLLVNQLIFDS